MKVDKNKVVSFHYTVTDNQGNLLDSTSGKEPLQYIHGSGGIIPGLEKEMEGKAKGDKYKVTVEPEGAYGERDESLVQEVPKSQFEGIDVEKGMQFQVRADEEGVSVVTVIQMSDDTVTVDGNHPLAGTTLNFEIEVCEVREASDSEKKQGHVCGGGCHSCS